MGSHMQMPKQTMTMLSHPSEVAAWNMSSNRAQIQSSMRAQRCEKRIAVVARQRGLLLRMRDVVTLPFFSSMPTAAINYSLPTSSSSSLRFLPATGHRRLLLGELLRL